MRVAGSGMGHDCEGCGQCEEEGRRDRLRCIAARFWVAPWDRAEWESSDTIVVDEDEDEDEDWAGETSSDEASSGKEDPSSDEAE